MNPIKQAIERAGSASKVASALGVSPQAVIFWRDGMRRIPADKCPSIERHFGVRCEALRPDVDWAFIRGSAAAQPEGQGA